MVEKATTRQKGRSGPPMSLESTPVGEKILEWKHVPERLGPQAPGWAAQKNENNTRWGPKWLGRSICCSLCSVSNSLSHTTFQIKWEVHFFKEVFARLYYCVNMYSAWICIWLYNITFPTPHVSSSRLRWLLVFHWRDKSQGLSSVFSPISTVL